MRFPMLDVPYEKFKVKRIVVDDVSHKLQVIDLETNKVYESPWGHADSPRMVIVWQTLIFKYDAGFVTIQEVPINFPFQDYCED